MREVTSSLGVELHREEGLGDVDETLVGHVVDVDEIGLPFRRKIRVVHGIAGSESTSR